MRVWIVSCGVLFVLAQMLNWAQDWVVPLPFYILGGAILAIASNYEKGITRYWEQMSSLNDNSGTSNSVLSPSQQPNFSPPLPSYSSPSRPISFTIKQEKSEQEKLGEL